MDNKFGEVWARFDAMDKKIDDLKNHVNDEIQELKERVYKIEAWVMRLGIAMILLTPIYVKESRDFVIKTVLSLFGF